jgi:hypothetical protein
VEERKTRAAKLAGRNRPEAVPRKMRCRMMDFIIVLERYNNETISLP